MKFHIHIKADTEEELKEELREVTEILIWLRKTSEKWKSEFGYQNKIQKERWEKIADDWINKHKVFYRTFSQNGKKK